MVWPLWKTVWRHLKKLIIYVLYDLVILLQGIYPKKKNENTNLKKYMHPKFIAVLFPIAKIWKKPKCP